MNKTEWKSTSVFFLVAGAVYGVGCSLWFGIVYAVMGSALIDRLGMSPLGVVGFYLIVGLVMGVVLALIWPIGRWLPGAIVVGILTAAPLYGGAAILVLPRDLWYPLGLWVGAGASTIVGTWGGWEIWHKRRRREWK